MHKTLVKIYINFNNCKKGGKIEKRSKLTTEKPDTGSVDSLQHKLEQSEGAGSISIKHKLHVVLDAGFSAASSFSRLTAPVSSQT